MSDFPTALADVCGAHDALRPPNRVPVSAGAAANLFISRPGGASGFWNPLETPYMVEPTDMLASRVHRGVVFVAPAQTGKCLDVATPIATPAGWSTMGALRVGDEVFGPDGLPTTVQFVSEVKHDRPCYRVRFADGSELIADDEHRWGVERFHWKEPTWRYEVRTTAQLIGDLTYSRGSRYRYRVRNTEPLQCAEAALPVDPYLLGVWLGDGVSAAAQVSAHRDDAPYYAEAFVAAGHHVDIVPDGANTVFVTVDRRQRLTTQCQRGHPRPAVGGTCVERARVTHMAARHGVEPPPRTLFANTFISRLGRLGVQHDKHIPAIYLRASASQRLALLQGLMDTDGSVDPRVARCEFTSTSNRLVQGFMELARSLGLKPTLAVKPTQWHYLGERRTGHAWRIGFPAPAGLALFRLPRKAARQRTPDTEVGYRQIVAIEPVRSRPVKCIQVSNESHLFLAGRGLVPTHNTVALGEGWLAHAVANDPGDMLIVQMTQDKAREYSKQRIGRMMRHEKMEAFRGPSSKDATIHDRQFKHGMWLKIAWPTVTNLSSTSYRYVFITDYDRIPDDIDGEGDAWTLGGKRTTTFMSRGMIAAESSPGRFILDPHWRPATPHEAPPVKGILGIYNTSDRRRWQWQCPHCREWLEPKPGVGLFQLPSTEELLANIRGIDIDKMARQYARVRCPHGDHDILPEHKDAMNRGGVWLPDGQHLDLAGRKHGEARRSDIAGYWLGGAAATYVSWETMLGKHLQALLAYAMTGDELPWQTTVNTVQGAPYMARALSEAKAAKNPADRTEQGLQRFIVPAWARFLRATVDVQGGIGARFVVQVEAIGADRERTIIDRYSITESLREGEGGKAPVDPAAYPEDWDVLTERVMRSTYRVEDSEMELRVHQTVVDTGGEGRKRGRGQAAKVHEGTTNNAYAWWRRLRREGLHRSVVLIKGVGAGQKQLDWLVRKTEVGGRAGLGDVPLYLLNSNRLKDIVSASAKRESGPGALRFPSWLSPAWFDEFTAEVRNEDGTWTQIRARNESFDLCCYSQAGDMVLKVDTWRDWTTVPSWAAPLTEANSGLITRDDRRELQTNDRVATTPAARPRAPAAPPQRRTARSNYLG